MENKPVSPKEVNDLYEKLLFVIDQRGYFLNHDDSFSKSLINSLIINERRYGYQACPCRLASGIRREDLDIICPCYYRDADVAEYGACYCGLYVSKNVKENKLSIKSIPERRPDKESRINNMEKENKQSISNLSYSVWRCQVCGYICARDQAPDVCPICGVGRERFKRFM